VAGVHGCVCVVLIAILSITTGCARTARNVAEEATPGGIDGAMLAMSKTENRQQLQQVLHEPAMDIGRGIADGMIEGAETKLRERGVIAADGSLSGAFIDKPKGLIAGTLGVAGLIAIALGLLVIALATWLLIVLNKTRKAREEAKRHEADARRVSEVLHVARDRPWGKELEALLEEKQDPQRSRRTRREHAHAGHHDERRHDDALHGER
jgi:hypothetical protein